jgi:hypothetical protein
MRSQSKNIPTERWDHFLRSFREQVVEASDVFPTVRCWTRHNLEKMIMSVIKAQKTELVSSTFYTATEIIHRLQEIGWLSTIVVDSSRCADAAPELFLLDMEVREEDVIDPLEVLQGYKPQGVLCYFGVLGHLGLTTQIAPFFHVAYIDKSPLPTVRSIAKVSEKIDEASPNRNPLGQEAFQFEGAPCYVTKRNIALTPGIQTRIIGPRTMLRMTTLEQALLDALGYPLHCGGESVVFEVWERGTTLWNPDRLADYLLKINRSEIDRRVGAMTEALQIKMDSQKLQMRLDQVKAQLSKSRDEEVPLLPGFTFPNLNPTWGVRMP